MKTLAANPLLTEPRPLDRLRVIAQVVAVGDVDRSIARRKDFAHAEDDDETLQWLENAYEQRDQIVYSMGVDTGLDRVRSNPRFTALLKKMGLEK